MSIEIYSWALCKSYKSSLSWIMLQKCFQLPIDTEWERNVRWPTADNLNVPFRTFWIGIWFLHATAPSVPRWAGKTIASFEQRTGTMVQYYIDNTIIDTGIFKHSAVSSPEGFYCVLTVGFECKSTKNYFMNAKTQYLDASSRLKVWFLIKTLWNVKKLIIPSE